MITPNGLANSARGHVALHVDLHWLFACNFVSVGKTLVILASVLLT